LITSQSSLQQSRSPSQLAPFLPHEPPLDDVAPDAPLEEPPLLDPPELPPPEVEVPEDLQIWQYESQFFESFAHLSSSGLQHDWSLCAPSVQVQPPLMHKDAL
jgi:hypothetical protein